MVKVMFVCLGNICRSPMAEAIFNHIMQKNNLEDQFVADSSGTAGYHTGESPHELTRQICADNQVPISHRAQRFQKKHFSDFDWVVGMDKSNLQDIRFLANQPDEHEKVLLMRDFDPGHEGKGVPDPYYGGKDGFKDVLSILERSIRKLAVEKLGISPSDLKD